MTDNSLSQSPPNVASEELIRALGQRSAWPADAPAPEVLQTHISVLFLVGDRVYKVKKPVDLGFLDFTDRARRRHFCAEEVRLNRRLAPDVYLGVAPVLRDARGALRIGVPGAGDDPDDAPGGAAPSGEVSGATIVDWAVVMRRLPAERMLESLLEAGGVDDTLIESLARTLVAFHERAARGPEVDEHGGFATVAFNARENFAQLAPFVGEVHSPTLHRFLAARVERFLDAQRALLEERVASGHICEGHGDLHASNICATDEGLVIYDCIEFSRRFRCGDVAADLAFLAMDLDARGEGALSRALVTRYAALAADPGLSEVIGFYKAYRAVVRGKVAAIMSREGEVPAAKREAKRLEALRYLQLAARYDLPPALVLLCGLPASGKSTVARHLAALLDAELLRSDVRRKELAGLSATTRVQPGYGVGLYSAEAKAATYASLLESTRAALAAGRSVVVDASFAEHSERERFAAAARDAGVRATVVHVEATEAQTRARMAARASDAAEASDADLAVWSAARARFEPPGDEALHVRSEARPLEVEVAALFERWLAAS